MDNSVDVQDHVIRVTTGSTSETLINVPLAGVGELDPQAIIRLTVGFDSDLVTSDNVVRVGITDGISFRYGILAQVMFVTLTVVAMNQTQLLKVYTSYYPGEVTMLFQPFYKYGSCYTGHIATLPHLLPHLILQKDSVYKLTVIAPVNNTGFITFWWKSYRIVVRHNDHLNCSNIHHNLNAITS